MWSTLNKYLNIDIRSNNIILIVYVSFWCEARVQISSLENSHSWKESNKGLSQNGGHFLFFSPEIWWFEKRFHSLTNSDGSVSVSLLSHPAVHCDPVRLAGSDGPRHTQVGSQGGTGTSPRPTWTLVEHPVGLMPARTDGGLCPPDRGLFGEKDKRGWPFFTKWCSTFSIKFRLLSYSSRNKKFINTSHSNSFSAAHYHLSSVIEIFIFSPSNYNTQSTKLTPASCVTTYPAECTISHTPHISPSSLA